ncbi:MAG: sulfate adenylyltransferase [Candidatus Korarchaeota archaeon]|nr:sulfate adenylyltransferase [Candidatus Korarchaeota archaeon]
MPAKPHGGKLINRVASKSRLEKVLDEVNEFANISVDESLAVDVENIARGVYSPLEGFMVREDFESSLLNMRLANDIPWTIPIVLDVTREELRGISEGDVILLTHKNIPLAIMEVEEIYQYDKKEAALRVYGTTSPEHPGVVRIMKGGDLLVGGRITLLKPLPNPYERYTLWPYETRVLFKERGWKYVVGFQTRNAPHMGHEAVQKTALAIVDGLFINPVIGKKKPGDFKDEVILAAYRTLIDHYFPRNTVVLVILRYEMRYAGPREAIHHAIMRKNFGCTHFIVGRDHAGVGNFYGPYDAQEIFKEFPDLGVSPLFFREFFFCHKCGGMVNEKTCPHPEGDRVRISGTLIRQILEEGREPPKEIMRPEVARTILKFSDPFVR